MVQLVQDIARHTRKSRSMPEFVIVGQNAPLLCEYPDYVATVDAVALEDLFYYRKRKRDGARRGRKYTRFILDTIAPLRLAGKPIFVVDYLPKAGYRRAYAKKTAPHTLIPFAAPSRALDRLP